MVYSCAYFETGQEDLNQAQQAKLRHLCSKLRLQPGDRLLDVGCGWGGLARFAASEFDVEATASPSARRSWSWACSAWPRRAWKGA